VGILLAVNRLVRLISNAPAGVVYDRWPRRRLFIPALFLGAISTGFYALTTGFWPLFVGRILWGLAWTGIWVGGNTMILDITREIDRGRWIGRYQAAFFLGAASGAAVGGVLTDFLGFHLAMGVGAAIQMVGAGVAWALLPETRQMRKQIEDVQTNRMAATEDFYGIRPDAERNTAYALLGVNRLVVAGVIPATLGLFIQGQLPGSFTRLDLQLGVATIAGLGLGFTTFMSMLTVPAVGRWSDRTPTRWHVVSYGLLAGAIGFASLSFGGVGLLIPGLFLIAWMSGSNTSLSTALVGDLSEPDRRSRRLGILFTIGDCGSAVGPPIAFFLLPLWGLEYIYLGLAGVLVAMLLIAAVWVRRGQTRPL
jgi:MFS family permease